MYLVLLSGADNSGKTTILNNLAELLSSDEEGHIIEKHQINAHYDDYEYTIIFRGKTIVICTHGDFRSELEAHCKKFGGKCDLLICATRTEFIKINVTVPEQYDKMTTIVQISKSEKDIKKRNADVADYLVGIIRLRLDL